MVGQRVQRLRLLSPFVLRSVDPPIDLVTGAVVRSVRRVGKRIVLVLDEHPALGTEHPAPGTEHPAPGTESTPHPAPGTLHPAPDVFLVLHLMIAGRLRWREPGQKLGIGPKLILAVFEFPNGTLVFTEASSKKRASLQLVRGEAALAALDPGGLEPLTATLDEFKAALTRENHTVKRALTDPHLFSGIGNAYSDEILHAAKLSPVKLTRSMSDEEIARAYDATRATLLVWIDHLRRDAKGGFPEKVTAFRGEMAVHGRYRQPCPVCGVRRIGKRLVLEFSGTGFSEPRGHPSPIFLVIHLMIAGRLRWRAPGQKRGMGPKVILASFEFPTGTLFFTEASSKKRASIQLVRGTAALGAVDPGGVEPLDASVD